MSSTRQPGAQSGPNIPETIAAINRSCHKNGTLGRRFDMIYQHYFRQKKRRLNENMQQLAENTSALQACKQLTLKSTEKDSDSIIVEGRINVVSNNPGEVLPLSGLVVAIDPDDQSKACVVFDFPGRGLVPSQCDVSFLPGEVVDHLSSHERRAWRMNRPELREFVTDHMPAERDSVIGHIITSGDLLGRVVDDQLLAALKGGCLRRGLDSRRAYYTLQHTCCSNGVAPLRQKSYVLDASNNGLRLSPASHASRAAESILRCGEIAKESLLFKKSYVTLKEAMLSLVDARTLDDASHLEKCVQTALGGDTESMRMGSFIACKGQTDVSFASAMRCACGFQLPGMDKKIARHLLRKRCSLHVAEDER